MWFLSFPLQGKNNYLKNLEAPSGPHRYKQGFLGGGESPSSIVLSDMFTPNHPTPAGDYDLQNERSNWFSLELWSLTQLSQNVPVRANMSKTTFWQFLGRSAVHLCIFLPIFPSERTILLLHWCASTGQNLTPGSPFQNIPHQAPFRSQRTGNTWDDELRSIRGHFGWAEKHTNLEKNNSAHIIFKLCK